jgi:hypothetical protein
MNDLPFETQQVLLRDAASRDTVTARRKRLLEILLRESYLTRSGLIARVEAGIKKSCFGESAWEDTFYRDMRLVKQALQAAGYELAYSRKKHNPGYYLRGREGINQSLRRSIQGAVDDVDNQQVAITRRLQPRERVQQGLSITDLANRVVAYRRQQREGLNA